MTTETGSLHTPPVQPPRRKWLATAVLLFLLGFVILFLVSLQYFLPGKWWVSAETMGWNGGALKLVKGRGYVTRGKLVVEGLAEPGVALASLSQPAFHAEDYPVVLWSISSSNDKPETKVEFLWRTAENPNRVFSRQLEWKGNTIAPLHMERDTNWRGQVIGLALMVHAPMEAPLIVDTVELAPFSPLEVVWREWFGTEPWLGTSINFVGGNDARKWVAPLPFLAAVLGLAMLGYWFLIWRKILVPDIRILWALVFIAWFALDIRWQLDLWQKLGLTQQRYAGKSWEEKHLAAEDGPLFNLMQQIRIKLPSARSRVFLFADTEYISGRGAYYLYPYNVFNWTLLPPAEVFKTGDLIIFLGKDEVKFDSAQHLLTWGTGQQLSADLLLLVENNALFRVR